MRTWSIGICTPIPKIPVDQASLDRDKVRAAQQCLDPQTSDLPAARRLLAEATAPPPSQETHLGLITPEWQRARAVLQIPMGHAYVDVFADGMEIGVARCAAVNTAIAAGLRYLFLRDWDVIAPQDTLMKLVWHLENNPDYGLASGVYCQKSDPAPPLLWQEWNNGVFYDWTAGEVLKGGICGVPMGCCLLRLSLFDKLPNSRENPWFKTVDEPVRIGADWHHARITEDLWFCKRYAEECQGKILVDTSIQCHHICHHTGRRYRLAEDSLPMKRARQRQANQITNGE